MKTQTSILASLVLALSGCASQLTEEEIEVRRQIDLENWNLCELAIKLVNDYTIHVGHSHSRNRNRNRGNSTKQAWIIRDDIRSNQCRYRLGKYWVKYPEAEWKIKKREEKEKEKNGNFQR